MLDVRQAEQLVYGASGQIANLERSIEQQENFISVLLRRSAGRRGRGVLALSEQPRAADVPAGLPSTLLERRPDIQRAEQLLVACERRSRRGQGRLFSANQPHRLRRFRERRAVGAPFRGQHDLDGALSALQPVFTAGRLRSRVELAEASRQETELIYQQTVQRAFGEVSDALVGYRKLREFREQQRLLVDSSQDARRLADLRYQGGVTSYLEVLDADTRLFVAELGLAEAERSELTGLVEIYRALGGGWQP
jgi:multidrug efflux system outer membrane protein